MSANSAASRPEHIFENGVGLADQLHVAVLDAVVDHLDVMAGAVRAHVAAAGFAIDLGGDLAEDRRDNFPRFARTARHERRTFERAFFAAGNAAADKMKAVRFQFLAAALRVGEKRIAAVDDDVALFEKRRELRDDGIHRRAGLDHDHRFARTLEGADEFLHRARRLDVFSLRFAGGEFLRHLGGAIENGDGEAFRFHVAGRGFRP